MAITTKAARRPSAAPRRERGRSARVGAYFLIPGAVMLILFFGLPVIDLILTSLSSWSGIGDRTFIGFANYTNLLTNAAFIPAIGRSVLLGVVTAFGITVIATVLAALVSGRLQGSGFYRIMWFLPAIAPASAVAVFWSLSVQPSSGVVNVVLGSIGLGDSHAWLADPATALWVVVAVAIWQGVGFAFLVILGAMEEIPVSTYEAASLDGASVIRQFFGITLPLARPVLSMIALLEVIWAFNGFTLVWGMTQGGPGDASTILPVLIYRQAFEQSNFGPAAAMSLVGGVLLLVIGLVGNWLGSRKGVDE